MTLSREARRVHARIANHERWHSDRPELADDARRELKTITLEEQIRRVVETAPLPTPAQLARLRALLRPGR
jgi:hypothetical protein